MTMTSRSRRPRVRSPSPEPAHHPIGAFSNNNPFSTRRDFSDDVKQDWNLPVPLLESPPHAPTHRPSAPARRPQAPHAASCVLLLLLRPCLPPLSAATAATASTACLASPDSACCATMALLRVLAFDHAGRPIQFDTWLDDLQLYLLSDSKDSFSLFDLASSAATAPPATSDSATRSQWLTRDAAARLAIRNHLPLAECTHFGKHRTAQALYDAVVTRYYSPATAALGRLLLPYLFPELSAFATVEDLVSHLRTSIARYRATVPAEFLDRNQPPMFITLYFIVTRLPDSLRSVRDHFLSLDPTSITVDLLEEHLLAAETSALAVGAARGTPRTPFFDGCSPSTLAPSYASAATVDIPVAEDVGAASASAKHISGKGKGGRSGGGSSGGGGGGSSGGGGGSGGGGNGGSGGGSGGSGGGGGGSGGSGGSCSGGTGGGRTGAQRRGDRAGQTCGRFHTQHRYFSRLDDAWHAEFGDEVEHPHWADLLRSGVAIFDLDFDAILTAMYALFVSAEGDCYRCVPPDPGIAAATLDAHESAFLGTAPAEALHTFTLDSGASGLHLPSFSTNLVSTDALQDAMVTTTTPGGHRVSIRTCAWTGRHLATFTCQPGSSLYTLATESPQVAACAQVCASGQVAPPYSCCLLSHQTLLWHHRLGHSSLPRLRGMHSRLLVSGLLRSLPPLLPSPTPPCLPCDEGRLRADPHSSFPPTTASLQTLHMDVWGPTRISGQDRERYFLLVVDNYTRYTTVFPLRSKGQVVDVLIPWIRTLCLQLHERFSMDLPVLHLHSNRGGEFSSDLLRDSCRGEGILQSFTLPASPQQNGIAERRIGLVMEVARTSMIHAAAPHFLWPFAVRYAAHQLNLWPRVSLPKTSPTLRWTGEVCDASVFRFWGSRAFVRDSSADKLFARAIPCVFLGFPPDARGWQFYHPTSRCVLSSQDVTFDESVPFNCLEWLVRRARLWSGAAGAGATRDTGARGAGVTTGAGGTVAAGPRGARTRSTRAVGTSGVGGAGAGDLEEPGDAGAGGIGAGGTGAGRAGAGGAGDGGAGAVDPGAGGASAEGAGGTGAGGTMRTRPYFVPLLQQPASPLPTPSPYTEQIGGLIELREPVSRPVLPVRTARRVPRSRPPPVPGTHAMALCPSSVPLRVPLLPPLESSLPAVPDPESDLVRAASPNVSRLLATFFTDPSFHSTTASALVAELLDFAAACCLDYATALVAESESASPPSVGGECALGTDVLRDRQEDFECLAAAVPRFASMLLAPEGDLDAQDIPTPRSYAEAIMGPYSSQWQAAMDAEMASWKSTGTYVNAVPPSRANIVDGMWIFCAAAACAARSCSPGGLPPHAPTAAVPLPLPLHAPVSAASTLAAGLLQLYLPLLLWLSLLLSSAGASPSLSPQQLHEWFVRRTRLRSGATGAGGAGPAGAGGTGVAAGAGVTRSAATTSPGGAHTRGTGASGIGGVEGAGAGDLTESGATGAGGAGAGGAGVGGPGTGDAGVGGPGVGGAGAGGAGAVDPGGAVRPRPYFVPLLQQVLDTPPSAALTPPLLCPPPDQSQPPLLPASPLPAPSPYTEQSGGLTERREPASRPVSPVRTACRFPRSRPPPVPGTHAMTLRPSSVPLSVPPPAPPESSLPEVPDPESDRARAASPTVSRLLATADTDPSFESVAASALVAELLGFAAACRLDYAMSEVHW
ncbi:unnamed protein product [Closterium sp. NIES-54]